MRLESHRHRRGQSHDAVRGDRGAAVTAAPLSGVDSHRLALV